MIDGMRDLQSAREGGRFGKARQKVAGPSEVRIAPATGRASVLRGTMREGEGEQNAKGKERKRGRERERERIEESQLGILRGPRKRTVTRPVAN